MSIIYKSIKSDSQFPILIYFKMQRMDRTKWNETEWIRFKTFVQYICMYTPVVWIPSARTVAVRTFFSHHGPPTPRPRFCTAFPCRFLFAASRGRGGARGVCSPGSTASRTAGGDEPVRGDVHERCARAGADPSTVQRSDIPKLFVWSMGSKIDEVGQGRFLHGRNHDRRGLRRWCRWGWHWWLVLCSNGWDRQVVPEHG